MHTRNANRGQAVYLAVYHVVQCKDRARGEVLSKLAGEIGSLTSCAEVTVQQAGVAAPAGCAPAVIDDSIIVHLLLAGILDPQKEIDKLQKEKVCRERWCHVSML